MQNLIKGFSGAVLAAALFAAPAYADTFANWQQDGQADTFVYTNTGSGASISATGTGRFDFNFLAPYGLLPFMDPLVDDASATMTISGTTSSAALVGGGQTWQTIDSGSITFTRTTPFDGKSILLKIDFTNGMLNGATGGKSPVLNVSDLPPSSTVTFFSDFLDFSGVTEREFSLSLSGASDTFKTGAGGFVGSFTADATGTASATFPAVPEPATWGLMIMGFGGIGAALRNRRRSLVAA